LRPRRYVELAEHLAEVIVDGARADEQLLGDLTVRRSGRREVGYPRFLTREVEGGLRGAGPGALAGRAQLCCGPLGEPVRPIAANMSCAVRSSCRAGWLGRAEFGLKQFFGERFAGLFVPVERLRLVTVFDGVGKDPG
jgi:hypothetical protein